MYRPANGSFILEKALPGLALDLFDLFACKHVSLY